ncbi:MAG: assimilatory sulfite reductase (NADPH) flavoprotein subunit [Lysobacteraceae bacterium]|nr:MAG: assimilatory sulfite reductase (NADPH) flavoprotein subunit [Xanthomonadaceae bacterium]
MSSAALALPAPLTSEHSALLAQFAAGTDATGLLWASGYLAGLARSLEAPVSTPIAAKPATRATVLYGSQTGNARRAAETLHAKLEAAGLPARLLRADAYPLRELKEERLLYIAISTQGDADPPDDALVLVEFLSGKRAPPLPQLNYAVLALGDSSYPQFCAIGQRIDARLAELGAARIADCANADLDVEAVATPWTAKALAAAQDLLQPAAPIATASLATVVPLRPHAVPQAHGRERPFAAELLVNQRITGRGSARDIRHLELSLEGSGLRYEPGDALGVWPRNPPALVDAVLAALALDGDALVAHAGDELPLREWLAGRREITRLSRPFIASHAAQAGDDALDRLLAADNPAQLATLLGDRQLIDLLRATPAAWNAGDFVAALRPLQPRLYSIASSRKAVGEEAHLAVAHVEYDHGHGTRWGAASHFLASRGESATVGVYIESNERFRLPADASRDIVMIGPGTGVAPFRGFVQERREHRSQATGASGRNWLLFGNSHARSEFLYQVEWQQALKDESLHRLDLAFSRDQAQKIYVQHRLREHGRELYAWLENGAHLYVCGALAMGKDVHAALLDVVAHERGVDADAAAGYVAALQAQGRYARDIY